jgi:polar amino acid transport system substrate-binding protein
MPLLLGGINDGAKRIKNIVQDLKSFARKDVSGFDQKVDLNKVIQTSVNLTANLISKSTDNFKVKYTSTPVIIKGNKQKLEQVLINLIENSCQALENRDQSVIIKLEKNNLTASIFVEDKGIGVEANLIKNITDPFFTTKRNNGGTGLGLSIATKILMQHNGKLDFQSETGSGTTAILTLPLYSGE